MTHEHVEAFYCRARAGYLSIHTGAARAVVTEGSQDGVEAEKGEGEGYEVRDRPVKRQRTAWFKNESFTREYRFISVLYAWAQA